MKSYPNLEQCKKLMEFLPMESADMFLAMNGTLPVMSKYIDDGFVTADETAIPCWSLTALLNALPEIEGAKPVITLDDNCVTYPHMSELCTKSLNLVDSCYGMIVKLHERNIL